MLRQIYGTQAEYVRVPFADTSTYPLPAGASDEDILMLADILPTGYEVGVLNGCVRPGDVVAIDLADTRLEAAKTFGAERRPCARSVIKLPVASAASEYVCLCSSAPHVPGVPQHSCSPAPSPSGAPD